ncbi:hypothetical protein BDV93DRAFT_514849 [Ceratobasidium sp. AG-I]|nr:hypothetical protein BDV93DRAFT_514849 [Ceratobasidium sp. AG-I]
MAHPAPVSSNENEEDEIKLVSRPRSSTIMRPNKRNRGNSSPLASRYRVFVDPNEETIPSLPTSREPTPAETEVETSSAMSNADSNVSNTAKKARRKNTALKRANGVPEVELTLCIGRIKDTKLPLYESFGDPFLLYNDDQSVTHYGFKCKACDWITQRQVGVSTTSGLLGHLHCCTSAIKQQHQLAGFGITGGNNSRMTAKQDRHLQKLLHPDARLHRPHRDTISKDVRRIYLATQEDIKKSLVLSFDTSLRHRHHQAPEKSWSKAHTGAELAKILHVVLVKFKIENQVWGVVCDNASNNAAMMKELAKFSMKRLIGTKAHVHCVLHVLNLVAVL